MSLQEFIQNKMAAEPAPWTLPATQAKPAQVLTPEQIRQQQAQFTNELRARTLRREAVRKIIHGQ
jgi:hypothetical protein